ncbi:hypothetical protein AK830_g5509 [Neonectria ditissima]|uniref:FAD dependent oxidoreductase domain-containing protein n=1 Tax=Neonectria ditissima TaxID=78410 RepID=A0A0P7BE73_9HYPO|nr:hypothetical protein AK830_g5509 [Neonectria ditissima]
MPQRPSKDDPIIIVGAGIFGLSTALHLARRGYSQVVVFDRQNYDIGLYFYQKRPSSSGMRRTKNCPTEACHQGCKVFHNSGAISINAGDKLPPFEKATIQAMTQLGRGHTQLVTTDPEHGTTTQRLGFNVDQFGAQARGKATVGVLDTSGGFAVADKACRFALHKARKYGAKFVFGPLVGAFQSLVYEGKVVVGIRTKDGSVHRAKQTIVACGSYTPVLVPELDGLCEATAGSVVVFRIPKTSPLFTSLAPENFPAWMYNIRSGEDGGFYGFPMDSQGLFKIGYRGTKYTNPQVQPNGRDRSVPVTRYTKDEKITEIPAKAMDTIVSFVGEYLPGIFHQDQVPQQPGLMVATRGSGHAFKYLPNIGNWVVDILEGVDTDRPAIKAWRWRTPGNVKPANVLMEGKGSKALQNVVLTDQING